MATMQKIKNHAEELASQIRDGSFKAVDAVESSLDKIQKKNSALNAIISTLNERALDRAQQIDKATTRNGKLFGVPVVVKDNFCVEGSQTTAGSKILKGFVSNYSATVIERLEAQGAVVIAKANMDEFAMGSSNENSAYGAVKNPWNEACVPGGSSGGSAAAVASEMAPIALGTDTGGSIRLPAHYCGVYGLKPTYGRVSRYGIVAFASSLDQAGPMARSVRDLSLAYDSVAGFDHKDSTTYTETAVDTYSKLTSNIKGKRIGVVTSHIENVDQNNKELITKAIDTLKSLGATVVEIDLPYTENSISVYYMIATSEASSNLARYDGIRYGVRAEGATLDELYENSRGLGFGPEVKRRIMLGTYALSSGYYDAYYKKACQVRRLIKNGFQAAFEKCDLIVGPVATSSAFKLTERSQDPLKMYLNDIYTTSINLAGLPALSAPIGIQKDGLPVGLHLIAKAYDEQVLLNVALSLEEALPGFERTAGVRG